MDAELTLTDEQQKLMLLLCEEQKGYTMKLRQILILKMPTEHK